MSEIILGMIGFILAGAVFAAGFYFGKIYPVKAEEEELDPIEKQRKEEEQRQNERVKKNLNAIANYSGKKGRRGQ